MESQALRINGGWMLFVLIVIYRPGSQTINDDFFNDLSDVLDVASTDNMKLRMLFDSFNMCDYVVHQHTHTHGHQLDVIVARRDRPVVSVRVDPPVLSDHSLITATFDVVNSATLSTRHVLRRRW
jgi:hypothetical protein